MNNTVKSFGSMVFGDAEMKKYLSKETYEALVRTVKEGRSLHLDIADAVAEGMKEWATEKGATHYSHWFQPMTGITAEKHDSFICLNRDGEVIYRFSGKELIKGESDASALPSGGLRATFEARGYTAWDATSPAFVKGNTLYIPTAFCSFSGQTLDKKTPLLRSMEKIDKAATRILRLFSNDGVKFARTTVGTEQEYFLVPKEIFDKRCDLLYTGRTLFGCRPPKGQELDDHYYGSINPDVAEFMAEVDDELWKLGVPAKTEHNEAAPAQHELAPIFTTSNISADQNQLTMEVLRNVARKHGFVCLLHEKPFDRVNGSGKHNNWSISTDGGVNLLEPGETPGENAQFLLFLVAVISAIDRYPELIRVSVAGAGNDRRLGGNEAPPAIISIFLGDELTDILSAIEHDTPLGSKEKELLKIGVHTMPKFPKDTTDRNRTSPIAFTGNKFEFRTPGSSQSVSDINTVINASVAAVLNEYADKLENANDFKAELSNLIKSEIKAHKRIIFNGNGYGGEWTAEAKRRGLPCLPTTPDALEKYLSEKNVSLFTSLGILTREEMESRYEIMLENYSKLVLIEALTMTDMTRRDVLPAICEYMKTLIGDTAFEKDTLRKLKDYADHAFYRVKELELAYNEARDEKDSFLKAEVCRDKIIPTMDALRQYVDSAELITSKDYWPYPSVGDLLFAIH